MQVGSLKTKAEETRRSGEDPGSFHKAVYHLNWGAWGELVLSLSSEKQQHRRPQPFVGPTALPVPTRGQVSESLP